jgi:predicted nucleic acid-binding protein
VIHLDTSFLIGAGRRGTREERHLRRWLSAEQVVRMSAIAWAEYLCGPVSVAAVEDAAELVGEPIGFVALDATLAAQLFNAAGRRRGTLADCMIAATAIRSGAALATVNVADFARFAPLGLTIADV